MELSGSLAAPVRLPGSTSNPAHLQLSDFLVQPGDQGGSLLALCSCLLLTRRRLPWSGLNLAGMDLAPRH